jgi:hypothetical protein
VELIGATPETALRLAAIPGVRGVSTVDGKGSGGGSSSAFAVAVDDRASLAVQTAITRLAYGDGMTVVEARPETVDLEDVFLRLVGNQEIAA